MDAPLFCTKNSLYDLIEYVPAVNKIGNFFEKQKSIKNDIITLRNTITSSIYLVVKEGYKLFELNKIIGIDDSRNNILVTLTDGRCALVDLKRKGFVVEVLLGSFFKWMSFSDNYTEEDADNVKSILANPQGVGYGPLAERYISDTKVKQEFDKIKKEIGYEY